MHSLRNRTVFRSLILRQLRRILAPKRAVYEIGPVRLKSTEGFEREIRSISQAETAFVNCRGNLKLT
jgi:hypothetical protein